MPRSERDAHTLKHVTRTTNLGGGNVTTLRKEYYPTALPDRPAQGSTTHEVTCTAPECGNVYRVRIDSTGMRLLHRAILWAVFPLLVLLTMVIPAQMGAPNSWIIYFGAVIVAWIAYGYSFGTRGVGRPRRVRTVASAWADHRTFF